MRVTVIVDDGFVGVDGVGFDGLSMDGVPKNIHAIQWKDGVAEIEYRDDRENEKKVDQSLMQPLIDRWQAAKDRYDAREADPFFDRTVEEARAIKTEQVLNLARQAKEGKLNNATDRLSSGGLQNLQELLILALIRKAQGDTAWTVDVILENDDPKTGGKKRRTLTADQVLNHIGNLYQAREDVNQICQTNLDQIAQYNSVDAIKNHQVITE
jgi:hypothetical protein